jgi:hypothetical protein
VRPSAPWQRAAKQPQRRCIVAVQLHRDGGRCRQPARRKRIAPLRPSASLASLQSHDGPVDTQRRLARPAERCERLVCLAQRSPIQAASLVCACRMRLHAYIVRRHACSCTHAPQRAWARKAPPPSAHRPRRPSRARGPPAPPEA